MEIGRALNDRDSALVILPSDLIIAILGHQRKRRESEQMNINNRKIWQVAAGDGERAYHDLLIEWDVIAIGPGEFGPWPDCEANVIEARTRNQGTIIRRFAEQMAIGDLVILRKGIL
jgi:hypothetical protein